MGHALLLISITIATFGTPEDLTPGEIEHSVAIVMNHIKEARIPLQAHTSVKVNARSCPATIGAHKCVEVIFSAPLPPRSFGTEEYLEFIVEPESEKLIEEQ